MDREVIEFQSEVLREMPGAHVQVEELALPEGKVWIDVNLGGARRTMGYLRGRGFGLYTDNAAYGEGPAQTATTVKDALELLRASVTNGTPHAPSLNLVVIRAHDIDRLAGFYSLLGLSFQRHRHGAGPEHLSSNLGGAVFEIYPARGPNEGTTCARLGFVVASLEGTIRRLREVNATILSDPRDSEFGRRAVVQDFEGHKVELYEAPR